IFSRTADTWLRSIATGALALAIAVFIIAFAFARSQYETLVARTPLQPVPFSHKHHFGQLGIDCRYCHTTVESSPNAGFPSTHVCMTCHSQLWTNADMLAPVRQSLAESRPIDWHRVTRLPDYVYFRHDIHIAKGIACVECHGRIDRMPLTYRAKAFEMKFCLDCHRDPAPRLRPREEELNFDWKPPPDHGAFGRRLMAEYHIKSPARLTTCEVCHR
ncbi:MAG TPA: cytochrome c3 family protein, partial [Sphingomicrobium sp.]|nr:cytochrome c3 family protein [Sphingomicrobium sp.]